jgi:hypothetical protein
MVLSAREVRRNSPSSGRPPTSSGIVCDRSPRATAPITRAASLVGSARSEINVLTESIDAAHAPVTSPSDARCASCPLVPTITRRRSSSAAMRSLSSTTSLNASAMRPSSPPR